MSEEPHETHHAADSHMDARASHGDDDGHGEPRLGPIDWPFWAYTALGGLAGVIVVAMFWVAIS